MIATQEPMTRTGQEWVALVHRLGPEFEENSRKCDEDDSFVAENYAALKEHGFFTAAIPEELGGGGVSHAEMCEILRVMGSYCGSTALAHSMHQHLLAANIWKYKRGEGGEEMLRKVVEKKPVLVSTGATDWLESNGDLTRCEGGYRLSGMKFFASQSEGGDVLVTSARFDDPEEGPQVLHFPVPMTAEGVSLLNDWCTMGMRGTGSHTVKLENVFVPEESIVLKRSQGEFHPVWNAILTVAMPMIMSVYLGIAQKAAGMALETLKGQRERKGHAASALGEMRNELMTAEVVVGDMVRIANDLDFEPVDENGQDILSRKTVAAKACIGVVEKAMGLVGGKGYYRKFGMEKLFRDAQGAKYHPLQERDQVEFLGEFLLKTEG